MMCNSFFECSIALLLSQIILFVIGVITLIVGLTSKVSLDVFHPSLEKISTLIRISEKLGLILRPAGWIIILISSIWALIVYSNSPLSEIQVPVTITPTLISTPAFATSTSNSVPQNILKLDELPYEAFNYGFGKDFIRPQYFSNLSIINGANSIKNYKLNFSMPLQGDAAAGIAFALIEPLDVTYYSHLEAVVQFKDSQCDLYMEDKSGAGAFVTISDTSPDSIRTPYVNGKWKFKLALTNFSAIDLHLINEIGCNAQRCEGDCLFELSELQFSKP